MIALARRISTAGKAARAGPQLDLGPVLGIKAALAEIRAGLIPAATFLAIYFTLTGAMRSRAGGLVAGRVMAGRAGSAMLLNRVRLISIYWIFVDVIWVIIFVVLYV